MVLGVRHLTLAELEAGLDEIRRSPRDEGVLELIARRPAIDEREVLVESELNPVEGLVGDSWIRRGSSHTSDGSVHPDMQLHLRDINAKAIQPGVIRIGHVARKI